MTNNSPSDQRLLVKTQPYPEKQFLFGDDEMCECSKIKEMIEFVEFEIKMYDNPGSYQDPEYYTKCSAKVDVLEDVLYRLKEMLK